MRGFTVMETGVALVLLAAAMVLVVQLGYWSVRHRTRLAARFVALELTANVLEEARAVPWDALTDDWGESRRLPEEFMDQLAEGRLIVRIEPFEGQPFTKRVSVELCWMPAEEAEPQVVRLMGLFSRRTLSAEAIKP